MRKPLLKTPYEEVQSILIDKVEFWMINTLWSELDTGVFVIGDIELEVEL